RFNMRVLQFLDCLKHKAGPNLQVIGLLVTLDLFKLGLFRRNQELKHEEAFVLAVEVVGQAPQPQCLSSVERKVPLRVISHQHFAESRPKGFYVTGEVFAVLKIELILPAPFNWISGDNTFGLGTSQYGCSELLVDQNSCLLLWHSTSDGFLETFVDDLFRLGNLCCLFPCQRTRPTEHARLE